MSRPFSCSRSLPLQPSPRSGGNCLCRSLASLTASKTAAHSPALHQLNLCSDQGAPKGSCFHNSWFQRHAASSHLSLKTVFQECHLIVEPNSHIHDLVLGEAVKSKYCHSTLGRCHVHCGAYQLWNLGAAMSDRDQNLSTSQRSSIVHPSFTCL